MAKRTSGRIELPKGETANERTKRVTNYEPSLAAAFARSTTKVESKIFDTDTVKGLRSAERYKGRLEKKYDKVTVTAIGLNRVYVEGKTQITPASLAAKFLSALQKNNYSPKMFALVGAVLGQDFGVRDGQGNQVTSLSITADGFVIGHTPDPDSSPFIGSADDLDRNLALVLADAKLNADEAALYTTLLFQNVKDWRS